MGRHPSTPQGCIESWILWHERYGTMPKTLKGYRATANLIIRTCQKLRLRTLPYRWNEIDVMALRKHWRDTGLTVRTQKGYDFVMTALAAHFNNDLSKYRVRWPHDERPNVKWMTLEEARELIALPMSEKEELCVHFMLCMGLRRVEVIRMQISDIAWDAPTPYIYVDGKGRKRRKVPFAQMTRTLLERWLSVRSALVERAKGKCRRKNRRYRPCDTLIIWERGGVTSGYSELNPQGFDDAITGAISDRFRMKIDNHTLRRTFGRELYYTDHNPVDLLTLSEIYGHESVKDTQKYIGPDPRRMAAAMILAPF